jgi:hypothetical protein
VFVWYIRVAKHFDVSVLYTIYCRQNYRSDPVFTGKWLCHCIYQSKLFCVCITMFSLFNCLYNLWKSMKLIWNSMEIHGNLWNSMKSEAKLRYSICPASNIQVSHEHRRKSMKLNEYRVKYENLRIQRSAAEAVDHKYNHDAPTKSSKSRILSPNLRLQSAKHAMRFIAWLILVLGRHIMLIAAGLQCSVSP